MTTVLKIISYSLLLMILVALNACSIQDEKKIESGQGPIGVTLSTVTGGARPAILASGEIEAVQTANISTRIMGRITDILVKVGDSVKKGQLLATVWDEDVKAKRAQAQATITEAEEVYLNARKDYDRYSYLYKQQSATAKELDNVTLQYNSAIARLNAAKQMGNEVNAILSYSRLTAPFGGVVTQKSGEVGNLASPGMPILTIQGNGALQVSASVAESDISKIHLEDIANVQIRSTHKHFDGKIIQINPSSQFSRSQYLVKISIPPNAYKDIYSGMFAGIAIPISDTAHRDDAPLIPSSAVINRDELTGIYTVGVDNRALLRWIRLGKVYGDNVEVTAGLSVGEKFICLSESRLYNGAPVIVKTDLMASTTTMIR